MKIKKAIISAAGFGTRFLPISKTIQKEMLPILNRPIIDYVVEDCIKAGIEDIVIIISEHNYQILHYYRKNRRLFNYLKNKNKADLYDQVKHLHQQANFYFVRQPDSASYGTAIPLKLVREHIQNEEAFLYLTGDDFIYKADDNFSFTKEMIDHFNKTKAEALVNCSPRPKSELHRYGVAECKRDGDFRLLTRLVEKPKPGEAPSNLANISKYILTPKILEIIDKQELDSESGELYVTDSLQTLAQDERVLVLETSGTYLDGGSVSNWLNANLVVARNSKDLASLVEKFGTDYNDEQS